MTDYLIRQGNRGYEILNMDGNPAEITYRGGNNRLRRRKTSGLSREELASCIVSLHEQEPAKQSANRPFHKVEFRFEEGCSDLAGLIAMSDHMNRLYQRTESLSSSVDGLSKLLERR